MRRKPNPSINLSVNDLLLQHLALVPLWHPAPGQHGGLAVCGPIMNHKRGFLPSPSNPHGFCFAPKCYNEAPLWTPDRNFALQWPMVVAVPLMGCDLRVPAGAILCGACVVLCRAGAILCGAGVILCREGVILCGTGIILCGAGVILCRAGIISCGVGVCGGPCHPCAGWEASLQPSHTEPTAPGHHGGSSQGTVRCSWCTPCPCGSDWALSGQVVGFVADIVSATAAHSTKAGRARASLTGRRHVRVPLVSQCHRVQLVPPPRTARYAARRGLHHP